MDEITKRWFDVSTVEVRRAAELDGWRSDDELIRLSGAPKGSRLEVAPTPTGRIQLRVVNQDLLLEPLVRFVSQEESGNYIFEIHNAAFVLRPEFRGRGIGTRSVSIELLEAKRLGNFSRVTVHAVGDRSSLDGPMTMNGYFVWARMGFNAVLPEDLKEHPSMPRAASGSLDLKQLLRSPGGEEFWLRFGRSMHLEFSLKEPSDCWDQFERYARSHNIEVTP
ncbi:hypothetical protein [Mitsuaria sp. 7]|uniref:hypothetical protein n=1 Tax=Mitsuaria sp. 7 TaxID=1658665 RepID=UPI0012FA78D4|nr:hypothetical protein [Mitsuaria sp. 7]